MSNMSTLQSDFRTFSGLGSRIKTAGPIDLVRSAGDVFRKGWALAGENAHSLTPAPLKGWVGGGKITRFLPIGGKTLTVGFTAAEVPNALKKKDPLGSDSSRSERMGALTGSTLGMLGATLPSRFGGVKSFAASVAGMAGGGYLGGKIGKGVNSLVNKEDTNVTSSRPA